MIEWISTLTLSEKIFWIIAVVFTVVFLFSILGSLFKRNPKENGRIKIRFFRFENCIAFFTIFGWVGIASLYQNYNLTTSISLAILCGLLMMGIMTALFYYINKMKEGGTLEFKNALNSTGEVNMEVGRKRSKIGKVQVSVSGTLREMDAITDFDHDIKTGTRISVESVMADGILIIKPLQ
ncbi:MAG: hypothetical protein WCY25_10645 [Moheibacter sp.]